MVPLLVGGKEALLDSVGMLTRAPLCDDCFIRPQLHMPSLVLYKVTIGRLARTLVVSLSLISLCPSTSVRRIPSPATVDR